MKERSNHGFTLIELLVVISIIGLLASIILVPLQFARTRAIAAKAVEEMRSLQNALELYAAYHNGTYPYDAATPLGPYIECGDSPFPNPPQSCDILSPFLSQYISLIPHSPISGVTLGYITQKNFGGVTYYCGRTQFGHYMIFIGVWNTPGLPLQWAEASGDGGTTFVDIMNGQPHLQNSGSYCLYN